MSNEAIDVCARCGNTGAQGAKISTKISTLLPDEGWVCETCCPKQTLKVESLQEHLEEHFTDQVKEVFACKRFEMTPECKFFSHVYNQNVPLRDVYADFAVRLNETFAQLDGRERSYVAPDEDPEESLTTFRPIVDSALAPPMLIPLANKSRLCVAYVFVLELPDGEPGRVWLNQITGGTLLAVREGEMPKEIEA